MLLVSEYKCSGKIFISYLKTTLSVVMYEIESMVIGI